MYLFLHVKYEQRSESVSSHIKTLELRKKSNSTANAFVTVTYSYEMESDFLRSFCPSRYINNLI
jgi:hypothetical protein